jgi:hypothetical protein
MVDVRALSVLDTVFSLSKTAGCGQQLQSHVTALARTAIGVHGCEQQLVLPAHALRVASQQRWGESRCTRQLVGIEEREPQGDVVGLEGCVRVTEELVEYLKEREKVSALEMRNAGVVLPCPR